MAHAAGASAKNNDGVVSGKAFKAVGGGPIRVVGGAEGGGAIGGITEGALHSAREEVSDEGSYKEEEKARARGYGGHELGLWRVEMLSQGQGIDVLR